MPRKESSGQEAARFSKLLTVLTDVVPEVARFHAISQRHNDEPCPLTLVQAGLLVQDHLYDTFYGPAIRPGGDVWRRLFQVVEIAVQVQLLIYGDRTYGRDWVTLDAFGPAGVICDATRDSWSLARLLRWMGPLTTECAREEVGAHTRSRGFDESAIDWRPAGRRFVPLGADPAALKPRPRR